MDNISEAHQRTIDKFNSLYAGRIEVVPINLPFSKFSTNDRKELLARSLRSRSGFHDRGYRFVTVSGLLRAVPEGCRLSCRWKRPLNLFPGFD